MNGTKFDAVAAWTWKAHSYRMVFEYGVNGKREDKTDQIG